RIAATPQTTWPTPIWDGRRVRGSPTSRRARRASALCRPTSARRPTFSSASISLSPRTSASGSASRNGIAKPHYVLGRTTVAPLLVSSHGRARRERARRAADFPPPGHRVLSRDALAPAYLRAPLPRDDPRRPRRAARPRRRPAAPGVRGALR